MFGPLNPIVYNLPCEVQFSGTDSAKAIDDLPNKSRAKQRAQQKQAAAATRDQTPSVMMRSTVPRTMAAAQPASHDKLVAAMHSDADARRMAIQLETLKYLDTALGPSDADYDVMCKSKNKLLLNLVEGLLMPPVPAAVGPSTESVTASSRVDALLPSEQAQDLSLGEVDVVEQAVGNERVGDDGDANNVSRDDDGQENIVVNSHTATGNKVDAENKSDDGSVISEVKPTVRGRTKKTAKKGTKRQRA